MYPPKFDYRRAGSVEEAVALLADRGDRDARVLSGGHALVPEMKAGDADPDLLVDVSEVDRLHGIEVDDGDLAVGACTTYADAADSEALRSHAPTLADAAEAVGDVQIRNRGTVGGNLAQADPDGDLPPAAVAADATILAEGPDGERAIPADEFFAGANATALDDDEVATRIRVPKADAGAYAKKTHPASGYAMVGAAVAIDADDGEVTRARAAAGGATATPVRLRSVEDELLGASVADSADAAASAESASERAAEDLDPTELRSDPYASGEFRAQLVSAYAERALESALDDAAADAGGERR